MQRSKTDNTNLAAKLELRRHFLRKYHCTGRTEVLDCCQGDGRIWSVLGAEFNCGYWGVDIKPRKGRLKLDSVRILQQPGWPQTVIDIDTYGSPWKHWAAMLPNVVRPVTVFLTIEATMFSGAVDRWALSAMGLRLSRLRLPPTICGKLTDFSLRYCLALCYNRGIDIVEAAQMDCPGNARYIGVRLVPQSGVTKAHGPGDDHWVDGSHL
ncbi:MAG: hypothetical protein ABR964_00490 [Tepidisphaeraceae bacterium]